MAPESQDYGTAAADTAGKVEIPAGQTPPKSPGDKVAGKEGIMGWMEDNPLATAMVAQGAGMGISAYQQSQDAERERDYYNTPIDDRTAGGLLAHAPRPQGGRVVSFGGGVPMGTTAPEVRRGQIKRGKRDDAGQAA